LIVIVATASVARATLIRRAEPADAASTFGTLINTLKVMKAEVQTDADMDAQLNTKMECWCEKHHYDKSLSEVEAEILAQRKALEEQETKALGGKGAAQSAWGSADAAEKAAGAEKTKKTDEWKAQYQNKVDAVAELTATHTALVRALDVLKSHHSSALMQKKAIIELKQHLSKHTDVLNLLVPDTRAEMLGFLQAAPGSESYSSQSGEVYGILKEMEVQFGEDLVDAKANLASSQEAHVAAIQALDAELARLRQEKVTQEGNIAAHAKTIADTTVQLDQLIQNSQTEVAFLSYVKQKCADEMAAYTARNAARSEEQRVINEAIKLLSEDPTFHKLAASSFVQIVSRKNPRGNSLAQLASLARAGTFDKVMAAIDKMKADLESTMEDDRVKEKECKTDWGALEQRESAAQEGHDTAQTTLTALQGDTAEKKKALEDAETNVTTEEKELSDAREARSAASLEAAKRQTEQNEIYALVQKAINKLSMIYSQTPVFLQQPEMESDYVIPEGKNAPPTTVKNYSAHASGGDVMDLLHLLADSAQSEARSVANDERKDAKEWLTNGQPALVAEVGNKQSQLEQLRRVKTEHDALILSTKQTISSNAQKLESVSDEKMAWDTKCLEFLKNFNPRMSAMASEVDALGDAKVFLGNLDKVSGHTQ